MIVRKRKGDLFLNGESVRLGANEASFMVLVAGCLFLYKSLYMFYEVEDKVSARR